MKMLEKYYKEAYNNEEELPSQIRLDLCTVCQLRCRSCYMVTEPEKVKNGCGIGYLKFKDFKKFIDLNPHIREIEYSNSGEIFLNPDFAKIIEYAHSKGIIQHARNGVNLNYLSDEQAEALVKYNFDSITVSLDGASQETYEKYRVGGNFQAVINNIKKIVSYKKLYNSFYPVINWKYIVMGINEKDIVKAKELAPTLGIDSFYFKTAWNNDFPIIDKDFVRRETGIQEFNIFSSPLEQLEEYNNCVNQWFYCDYLWSAPQINWDGQVLGCCCNFTENFGKNALNKSLIKTLNLQKIIYAKTMIQGIAPASKNIPCYNCFVYREMKNANKWFIPRNR